MEPSLREAIDRVCKNHDRRKWKDLDTILSAAESWADHIDNEDPEGMQDRNCETCKHRDDDDDYGVCATCLIAVCVTDR